FITRLTNRNNAPETMSYPSSQIDRRKMLKAMAGGLASATFLPACGSNQNSLLTHAPKHSEPVIGANGRPVLPWSNWSGNQHCQPTERNVPRSLGQLVKLIQSSKQSIRCVGSGHSFSALVPTDETLISLARFRGLKELDETNKTATFGAGTLLGQTGDPLWEKGYALNNMPDINTQSLAGAIATSTHGTGRDFCSLSDDVRQLKMVIASGEEVTCNAEENTDLFNAARANLGALGVLTEVTMKVREKYRLEEKQWFVANEQAHSQIESLRDQSRHFEMYAFPHGNYSLMITIDETDKPILDEVDPAASGDAILELKKWTERLPWLRSYLVNSGLRDAAKQTESRVNRSYRVFGNLRNVRFNEMEYSVPAERGVECLQEILAAIKKQKLDVVFPIEYRYIKADNIWLSQFYERDSCAISCHNFADRDYKRYFAVLEPIFLKYGGRPHWGKIHTLNASHFEKMYPRWQDFKRLRAEVDPVGLFLNRHIGGLFT
ncbi:MAG: FAD-binding protein, partial [Acidiferrobacterales bacterium]|nr:FAD-binding protein [Acidiferrobacterales bacterium]